MPHKNRFVLPWLPHHVYFRGNNQRSLFSYPKERELFLYLLGRAREKWPCELNAIALMTNHVHVVVVPPSKNALSKFMQHALQRYAQERNAARGMSGKLIEQRFECIPITDEAQLASTLAYVDLNPVHGRIADEPAECKWSTYGLAVPSAKCRIPRGLWTPSPWYLALGSNDVVRAAAYAEWVADCRARRDVRDELKQLEEREALVDAAKTRRLRRPDGTRAV